MTTCTIRAAYARLAATTMAKNDIRYYLRGLLVEPRAEGGAYIVGTNGHCMMVVIDEHAQCDSRVIISPDATTQRLLPKVNSRDDSNDSKLELTEFRGKPALLLTVLGPKLGLRQHLQMQSPVIEGNFPLWRKVMPDFNTLRLGHTSAVNLRYITKPLDAFALTNGMLPGVETFQAPPDETKPETTRDSVIACRFVRHEYAVLLVMPLRGGDLSDQANRSTWKRKAEEARNSKRWEPPAPPPAPTTKAEPTDMEPC